MEVEHHSSSEQKPAEVAGAAEQNEAAADAKPRKRRRVPDKERTIKCPQCPKMFARIGDMRRHARRHGMNPP